MINRLLGFIFTILFNGLTAIYAFLFLPFLLFPYSIAKLAPRLWMWTAVFLTRVVLRQRFEVLGQDYMTPDEPMLIASKHQSAWETLLMFRLLKHPTYILKKELMQLPIFGWYLKKVRLIAVDRGAGASAMKDMVKQSKAALEAKRQVIIFPEGTRMPYGEKGTYHAGIYAIYKATGMKVTPLALNSGKYWPKKGEKKPGTILVEFLPPIEPGLKKVEFMEILEKRIEEGCRNLEAR